MLRKLPRKTLSADLQLAHVRAHFVAWEKSGVGRFLSNDFNVRHAD